MDGWSFVRSVYGHVITNFLELVDFLGYGVPPRAWSAAIIIIIIIIILCSKNFKTEGKILREELAVFTRNLLRKSYHPSLLEAFTSCRLIPLDKNPGIRPIGVGEVLRRMVGKTFSGFLKEELEEAAGPLHVCAGHNAGAEAAIHAMSQVFVEKGTDGILLIDASNAFKATF